MKMNTLRFAAAVLYLASTWASAQITGSGATGYIAKFNGTTNIGDSRIFQDSTGVGINTTSPAATLDVRGNVNAVTGYSLLGHAFAFGAYAKGNAFLGFAGNSTMSGSGNVASGWSAFQSNTTGSGNTATGGQALQHNSSGTFNTGIGDSALRFNTMGNYNTAVGVESLANNDSGMYNTALGFDAGPSAGALTNATAIGAYAAVSQSNALVLGGLFGGSYAVNVGIGTAAPSNVFTIAQSAGHAIADGWDTYSSRRFKTNIRPLLGALEKVESLQGVSYDRRSDGKSEIGVVAEDVAEVVPEVVSRDAKTHEVQGVDYSRLAALLIEAVKTQQAEIDQLKEELQQLATRK